MSENVLDFQDSEVSSAELQGSQIIIRFSAALIHGTDDKHNVDDGPGFIQALELTIDKPIVIETDSGCIGRLSQGILRVAGTTIKHVPIPYEATADVELELAFSNGSICKVVGQGVTLKPTGEVRVAEWLKC